MREFGFDEIDAGILAQKIKERETIDGPRVGDFVLMLDGSYRRFTHHWGDSIQTTVGRDGGHYSACFYLGHDGCVSFSGSLDPAIPLSRIQDTGLYDSGGFWFFHHNSAGAHRGVNCFAKCRVFKEVRGKTHEN